MYDIAIIGLGPAGATCARLLDRHFRVVAIDGKSAAADSFRKPCGGLLAPDAQKALSRFNLTLPKQVLVDPQIFAVKTIDTAAGLVRHYQRFYINLDRHQFDLWLASLIPPRVEVVSGAVCTDISRVVDGFRLQVRAGAERREITARYLIGADGANSLVRRTLFPERRPRQYVALQQWFPDRHATPFYSCIFDPEITDSYCWGLSKDGGFILGGAFPRRQARQGYALLKQKLAAYGFACENAMKTEACLIALPRGPRDFCLGGESAFLTGEAAGLISPSSLEGISYALNSGAHLAAALNQGERQATRQYRRRTLPLRGKLLLKRLKLPFMYWPWLRRLVLRSGLNSIDLIGD